MTKKADKRRVAWDAVRRCHEELVFDVAATSALRLSVGTPMSAEWTDTDLQSALNELAIRFAIDRHAETNPDAPPSKDQCLRVEKICRAILKALGDDGADIDPAFGRYGLYRVALARGEVSGRAATMNTMRAIRVLADDTKTLATIADKRNLGRIQKPGPSEEKAIKQLVASLSDLFLAAWNRLPGIARPSPLNVPDGAFVRLLSGVHGRLVVRGLDTMSREPDALAQIWNRLPEDGKSKDIPRLVTEWTSAMDELG